MKTKTLLAGAATVALAALAATEPAPPAGPAAPTAPPTVPPPGPQTTAPATPPAPVPAAVPTAPVPLDGPVRKALDWLAARQRDDGGWGQGGGWRVDTANQGGGRIEGDQVPDPSDVGNTAIALKAFLRAGTRLDTGDFAATARKAADYLLAAVEKADGESLHVTDVRGTQLQSKVAASPDASQAEKDKARGELAAIERADRDKEVLLGQVVRQAGEQQFVAGFGSNGGEEFASYMNIAEALHTKGGKPWNEWQARMDDLLHNAQHADGSWSGQHCITGRTFCTSTAVLVLTTDRLPGGDATGRQPVAP